MESDIITSVTLFDLGMVVLRTGAIFLYAFFLLRLLGKKRLAHFGYMDVLLIIAFGSAVGDVMIYRESTTHLFSAMVAITVVAFLVKLLSEVSSRSSVGSRIVEGEARLLIDKGILVDGALAKEDLTLTSLDSYLREKGIDSIKKVRKAFIEPDGEISVIPYKNK